MTGSVSIARSIFDHEFFAEEVMTEREAWIWLIMEASWKPRKKRSGDVIVDLKRGQLAASIRFMAGAWKWTAPRVQRYLKRLEKMEMILSSADTGVTVITVCNYDDYQAGAKASDTAPIHERYTSDTNEKKDEIREEGYTPPDGEDGPRPIDECAAAVAAYNASAARAGWPAVQILTPERRTVLKARLKAVGGADGWLVAMKRAEESDFLSGRTDRPFKASFDWLAKKSNFTKLMEGNYDNRPDRRDQQPARYPGRSSPHDGLFDAFSRSAARHS